LLMLSCRLLWRGGIREGGCDAFAVQEIGLREATEPDISLTRFKSKQLLSLYRGAAGDRLVANWQQLKSGAMKMVYTALAGDHAAHRVG
jgi:hypothetical protein